MNRLYQVNQEVISYGTYEIDALVIIIDTVNNLNNRTTAVEREILNRTLYIMIWGKIRITNRALSMQDK